MTVVVLSPSIDLLLRIGKRQELIHVQAFVSQSSVEALYLSVFHRHFGTDEVEFDAPESIPENELDQRVSW